MTSRRRATGATEEHVFPTVNTGRLLWSSGAARAAVCLLTSLVAILPAGCRSPRRTHVVRPRLPKGSVIVVSGTYRHKGRVTRLGWVQEPQIHWPPAKPFTLLWDGADRCRLARSSRSRGDVVMPGTGTTAYWYNGYDRVASPWDLGVWDDDLTVALAAQLGLGPPSTGPVRERREGACTVSEFDLPAGRGTVACTFRIERVRGAVRQIVKTFGGGYRQVWLLQNHTRIAGAPLARRVEIPNSRLAGAPGTVEVTEIRVEHDVPPERFQLPPGTAIRLTDQQEVSEDEWKDRIEAAPANHTVWYSYGRWLSGKREARRAAEAFRKCVELNGDVPEYRRQLASQVAQSAADPRDAGPVYEELLRRFPTYGRGHTAYAWFLRAKLNDAAGAARAYARALRAAQHPPSVARRLLKEEAQAWQAAGKLARAETAFRRLAAESEEDRLCYAHFLRRQGRSTEMAAELERVVEKNPDNLTAWRELLPVYEDAGEYRKCIEASEHLCTDGSTGSLYLSRVGGPRGDDDDDDDDDGGYYQVRGVQRLLDLWERSFGLEEATQQYTRMLEDPGSGDAEKTLALLVLTDICELNGEHADAEAYRLDAATRLASRSDRQSVRLRRAILKGLIRGGRLDQAVAIFCFQPEPPVLERLVKALLTPGRGTDVLAVYQSYLCAPRARLAKRTDPRRDASHVSCTEGWPDAVTAAAADYAAQLGLHEPLIERQRGLVDRDPGETQWRGQLGLLLLATGDVPGAEEQFEELLRMCPESTATLCLVIGQTIQMAGKPEQAIRFLERARASRITPREVRYGNLRRNSSVSSRSIRRWILRALGTAYRETGRLAEAEACYRELLAQGQLRPRTAADLRATIAEILQEQGKRNDLADELRVKLAAEPAGSEVRVELAAMQEDGGQVDEAISLLRDGIEEAPDDVEVRLALARMLERHGHADDAAAHYHEVLDRVPLLRRDRPARPYFARGNAYDGLRRLYRRRGCWRELEQLHRTDLARAVAPVTETEDDREQVRYRILDQLRELEPLLRKRGELCELAELWLPRLSVDYNAGRDAVLRYALEADGMADMIERVGTMAAEAPKNRHVAALYARLLWEAGRHDDALGQYDAIAETVPGGLEWLVRLAGSDRDTREREIEALVRAEAERILAEHSPEDSEYLTALRTYARLLARRGQHSEALKKFREWQRLEPSSTEARKGMVAARRAVERPASPATVGTTGGDFGDFDQPDIAMPSAEPAPPTPAAAPAVTIADLERVVAERPYDVPPLLELAEAYGKAGREEEAVACLEKASGLCARWGGAIARWLGGSSTTHREQSVHLARRLIEHYGAQGRDRKAVEFCIRNDLRHELVTFVGRHPRQGGLIPVLEEAVDEPGVARILASVYANAGQGQKAREL